MHTLIVGVSVQAVNNGAVDCEGTGMTQTAHGADFACVCACMCGRIHTVLQTHTKRHTRTEKESLIADLCDLSLFATLLLSVSWPVYVCVHPIHTLFLP